jgi:tetratricopeptide (TPR) repeat protein
MPLLAEGPGTVIGPYKLLQQIGEGGMGVVFMAEQTRPVQRTVALKIIKPGMDTRQLIARFEAERQALALMDHPNIAKVLDAETTDTGRPYFVMELVKGVAITKYCDEKQLSLHERLDLFLPVCQAVQHAHQKGIIHRDIKPNNVLVAEYDNHAVPKVIDFGVAKATAQRLTERTMFTEFGQVLGTMEYMSPEQAKFNQLDIDTRSDIYSLGVLLYELLTGTTPFERKRLQEAAFDEMLRIIREEEPPKPSTKLSSSETLPSIAANRHTEPARLSKEVRGELDWIVMKALEKDRNRRYDNAGGLARDVERYLHDESVQACPPSAAYRFRKFARRNKAALAIAGLILFFLMLMGIGVGWVARDRATRSAVADREANLALNEASEFQSRGKWPEAMEAIKRAEGILASGGSAELCQRLGELRKDSEMVRRLEDIRMPRIIAGVEDAYDNGTKDWQYARAFRDYGIDIDALQPAEAAERVRARMIRLELAAGLDCWASERINEFKRNQNSDDEGWKRIVAVARAADRDEWRNQVRDAWGNRRTETLSRLAVTAETTKLPVQTVSLLVRRLSAEEAVPVLRKAQQEYPDDFWINIQLAWYMEHLPRAQLHEAIRFYTVAVALRPRNVEAHRQLADVLRLQGKLDEANAVHGKAIDLRRQMLAVLEKRAAEFPDNHDYRLEWGQRRHRLAELLMHTGHLDEAEREYREMLSFKEQVVAGVPFPEYRFQLGYTYCHLAYLLDERNQRQEARKLYQEALTVAQTLVKDFPNSARYRQEAVAVFNVYLARHLVRGPDCEPADVGEAVTLANKAIEAWPEYGAAWNTLGIAHFRAGRHKAALEALEKSIQLRNVGDGFDWFFVAMVYWQLNEKDKARHWHDRAVQWIEAGRPHHDDWYLLTLDQEWARLQAESAAMLGIRETPNL